MGNSAGAGASAGPHLEMVSALCLILGDTGIPGPEAKQLFQEITNWCHQG